MVVKVFISGISGNKEVKKRQQRVLMILDSKNIKYEIIDITEPGRESDKDFMQNNSKSNGGTVSDPNPRSPLPPQLFNEEEYCGDYDQFDLANEVDTLEQFLKVEVPEEDLQENIANGDVIAREESKEEVVTQNDVNGAKLGDQGNDVVKESSVDKEDSAEPIPSDDTTLIKESSVEKETAGDRLKPDETEETIENAESSPVEAKNVEVEESSKENTVLKDDANENGAVSSREPSKEKEINDIKENPSEALIQSEQAVSAE